MGRKTGRPKKDNNSKLSKTVVINLTPPDSKRLSYFANLAGIDRSSYAREALLTDLDLAEKFIVAITKAEALKIMNNHNMRNTEKIEKIEKRKKEINEGSLLK